MLKAGTNYCLLGEHLPSLDYLCNFCAFLRVAWLSPLQQPCLLAPVAILPFLLVEFAAKYDIHTVVVLHPEASRIFLVIFILENICVL